MLFLTKEEIWVSNHKLSCMAEQKWVEIPYKMGLKASSAAVSK